VARGTETGRARCVGRSLLADAIAATDAVALQFQLQVIQIRSATDVDRDAIWNIFHEIIAAGDTYAFDPKMSREEALAYWLRADTKPMASLGRQRRPLQCLAKPVPLSALTF